MQVLTAEETMAAIRKATEPLKKQLEVQERILAKIPFRVSTAEAMALTGIKSDRTLKKLFNPMQDGPKGRITYSLVDIERWVAEKELNKAA